MKPELHPACAAFPPLSEEKLRELADDIAVNGLLHPITLMPDGRILDGRCRWDACEMVGAEPRTTIYEGDDPISFVRSSNAKRRHMTDNELVLAIAALYKPGPVGRQGNKAGRFISAQEIAEKAGRHRTTLQRAREINERAAPNVIDMVKQEQIGILTAAMALKAEPSHEEQANWTADTVRQEAHKRWDAGRGNGRGRPPKEKPPKPPRVRYGEAKFPSWEETGFPVDGTLEEKDEHMRRYGRTPLHPQAVRHMLDHRKMLTFYLGHIAPLAGDTHPDADKVIEALEEMLAWKPQPDPNKMGYGIRFAVDARNAIERLDKILDKAVARLTALQQAYRAWQGAQEAAE